MHSELNEKEYADYCESFKKLGLEPAPLKEINQNCKQYWLEAERKYG